MFWLIAVWFLSNAEQSSTTQQVVYKAFAVQLSSSMHDMLCCFPEHVMVTYLADGLVGVQHVRDGNSVCSCCVV